MIAATLQQPQVAETCAVGSALCHSKAICVDYNPGFCCQCAAGFIGNGRNCLTEGITQKRISFSENKKKDI